ncbi:AfsR/SARP family transcriptional regulator [Nocardia sp. NBC_00511]|uniref:AfsR/SARP family transcriptional regulator n=1 Tax=Nocardia sp. NBC_00511 TaxID=2903591 RepID=UPI0030DDEBE9
MKSGKGSSSTGSARSVSTVDSTLVALLGEVALRRDGALAAVPGARARLLVAALATHPGRSRSAQALIDEVWGEDPPRAPMNALHTQVSRLRSALPDGVLEIGPAGYRLVLAPDQVDLTLAHELEKQARQAHSRGDDAGCLELLDRARDLWRGEPAADLPPGAVADELTTLAETRAAALDGLELTARETIGDLDGAIELARRAAAADPLGEPVHGTLMRLLAASGRTNEALDVFATLRTRLVDQLGADPGPAVVALNTAILRGEPLPGAPVSLGRGGANIAVAHDVSAAPGYSTGIFANGDTASQDAGSAGRGTVIRGSNTATPDLPGAAVLARSVADQSAPGRARPLQRVAGAQHALEAREAAEAVAIGLRAAPNPLLGREQDLAELEQLLRSSRVTTVLGPGGTGKTRIANELGARLAHDTAVTLVELASLRADVDNPADTRVEVEIAIAATLGVADSGRETNVMRQVRGRDIGQRLREALAVRRTLLILDNCEHLIEAVAEVVADLVGTSDLLTVLTTSRAPLEITAETVYPLPPLMIDAAGSPATDLFEARARAVRPSVRLDPEVVARLCRTLDGLPLAIELAAARTRTMSVEEIDSRLDHRFMLLRSGDRSSPQRHRTLHAVIEWSWNLLDEPQRVALRRLCRFPAGFTLSAAETVLAGPEIDDPATAVDGLVSQSLLTVLDDDGSGIRYRMLETVREFGDEQLAFTGEADLVMSRMAKWGNEFALDTARRYHTADQVPALLGLNAEMDNLVAVLRYALEQHDATIVHAVFPALAGSWVMRGAHAELMSWSPRILALPPEPYSVSPEASDLKIYGQLLLGLHLMFGDNDMRAVARIRISVRRILNSGSPMSRVARYLGELVGRSRTFPQVARKLSEGVRSDDPKTRLAALMARANMRENEGLVYGSIRDAETALTLNGADGDTWGIAMTCQHLGSMYGQSARYEEAVGYYDRAVELMERLRAWDESIEMRAYLSVALAGQGEPELARRAIEPALGSFGSELSADDEELRPNHRLAVVASALSEIEFAAGDIEAGLLRCRQVLPLMNWPHDVAVPGPGSFILAATVIDAHVLHGRADLMGRTTAEMVDAAVRKLGHYWDLPQIGSVACAAGTYLLASGRRLDRGLELLLLAPKVFGRQDYPSMRISSHLDLHRPVVGDERFAAATAATSDLGRRAAAARILEHLEAIDGTF